MSGSEDVSVADDRSTTEVSSILSKGNLVREHSGGCNSATDDLGVREPCVGRKFIKFQNYESEISRKYFLKYGFNDRKWNKRNRRF